MHLFSFHFSNLLLPNKNQSIVTYSLLLYLRRVFLIKLLLRNEPFNTLPWKWGIYRSIVFFTIALLRRLSAFFLVKSWDLIGSMTSFNLQHVPYVMIKYREPCHISCNTKELIFFRECTLKSTQFKVWGHRPFYCTTVTDSYHSKNSSLYKLNY